MEQPSMLCDDWLFNIVPHLSIHLLNTPLTKPAKGLYLGLCCPVLHRVMDLSSKMKGQYFLNPTNHNVHASLWSFEESWKWFKPLICTHCWYFCVETFTWCLSPSRGETCQRLPSISMTASRLLTFHSFFHLAVQNWCLTMMFVGIFLYFASVN